MAYSITVLAMGGIFFPEGYTKSGQTNYLLDAVKWGTDYFIKCHVSQNVLYGQVWILFSIVWAKSVPYIFILSILQSDHK